MIPSSGRDAKSFDDFSRVILIVCEHAITGLCYHHVILVGVRYSNKRSISINIYISFQVSELQVQISVLEGVKVDLNVAKDKIDEKEAELEALNSEVAVFKETINGLKANLANKGQVCYQFIFSLV